MPDAGCECERLLDGKRFNSHLALPLASRGHHI
jgi:hypothetical protein